MARFVFNGRKSRRDRCRLLAELTGHSDVAVIGTAKRVEGMCDASSLSQTTVLLPSFGNLCTMSLL